MSSLSSQTPLAHQVHRLLARLAIPLVLQVSEEVVKQLLRMKTTRNMPTPRLQLLHQLTPLQLMKSTRPSSHLFSLPGFEISLPLPILMQSPSETYSATP